MARAAATASAIVDVAERDEGHDVDGADARVRAGMAAQVDGGERLVAQAQDGVRQGRRLADHA